MDSIDWDDRAFFDDDEWVTWSEINEQLRHKEWRAKYPNAVQTMIPYFESLISLAESYHLETGLHLNAYGDIGELFGAITYGIKLNRTYAQGADGRLGNDHVEIKTITPFKKKDEVLVDLSGNFSKLLVVKINEAFQVCGRMVDRRSLPTQRGRYLRVRWADLPSSTSGS
ncbi:hypothetical protein L0V05_07660 [Tabrizicola sp. J26]|nr:hypothetical protein [Tabrizicola rongguiensis]